MKDFYLVQIFSIEHNKEGDVPVKHLSFINSIFSAIGISINPEKDKKKVKEVM